MNLKRESSDVKFNNIKKSDLRRIHASELPDKQPSFRNSAETKDNVLAEWLKEWINTRMQQGKLRVNDLLPSKNEIAERANVSIGTVQTAIRIIEDEGYVASKQRIGTFIRDRNESSDVLRKQVSKREQAIESIKRFIATQGYDVGDLIPSSRELAKIIGSAPNTTRLAVEYLAKTGVITAKASSGNKTNWVINSIPKVETEEVEISGKIDSETLVDQVERDLKQLIAETYTVGDKLMSHYEIADRLRVSIKTVHDAMKRLVQQGILQSRRGRYGTFILRIPSDKNVLTGKEHEIFAPAVQASEYNYEKVESWIKNLIKEQFKPGDKLPAMNKLARELNVSSNTIRKALQNLADSGVVSFARGKYGGTFLLKHPEAETVEEKPVLTWVAVNREPATV
ncbi:MAG: GntR family transcriptional regulator [Candidatus Gastranaerophilales bacterium]|nr:GntR family transcriptional regulator [Candidatus Gastranaerophilales bacterium]